LGLLLIFFSAHWYVAIICNLPNLSRTLNKEEKAGSLEVGLGDKKSDGLAQVAESSSPNSPSQTTVADAVYTGYGVTEAGEQVARISLMQRDITEETGNPDPKHMPDDNAEDENWPAADENPPANTADGIPSISQDADYRVQAGNAKPSEDLAKVRVKAQHKLKKTKRRLVFRKYDIDEYVVAFHSE
jgi:sentrin-specific protease 7